MAEDLTLMVQKQHFVSASPKFWCRHQRRPSVYLIGRVAELPGGILKLETAPRKMIDGLMDDPPQLRRPPNNLLDDLTSTSTPLSVVWVLQFLMP